jgi:hypothetical protein
MDLVSRRRFLSAVHRMRDVIKTAKSSLIKLFRPLPTAEIIIAPSPSWSSLTHAPSSTARTIPSNNLAEPERTRSPSPMPSANTETQSSGQHLPEEVSDDAAPAVARPARRARFVQAIRSVIIAQQAQGPSGIPRAPPNILSPEGVRQEELRGLIRSSRVARLAPKLRDFAPTQEFAAHQALVRHLQFSPNGNLLATSRCVLFRLP